MVQGRAVERDAPVVADHAVGRDQGRAPTTVGRHEQQPRVQGVGEHVPDLPGTVGEPDVRMQDRRDPIVVVGEGAEEGAGQLGAASDEPLRPPCGGEHHQSPVRFHLQFGPVPVP